MTKKRLFLTAVLILVFSFLFASCSDEKDPEGETSNTPIVETTKAMPGIDDDVPQSLKDFYKSTLPTVALKSGVKNAETGEEISCTSAMIQKVASVDFDSDGIKELVLLYDISEEAGKANMDVAVFLDERNGQAGVVYVNSGSYGISDSEESFVLSQNNGRVCLVRVVKYSSCEAVLVQEYTENGWTSVASAYHHISNHDSVKLESDSYYVDHASGGLFNAVTGKSVYNIDKFRNYRIPKEAYDGLVNNFSAMSILP